MKAIQYCRGECWHDFFFFFNDADLLCGRVLHGTKASDLQKKLKKTEKKRLELFSYRAGRIMLHLFIPSLSLASGTHAEREMGVK